MAAMKKNDGTMPIAYRDCPTPVDDTQKLITQKVDPETCQGRQARHYHKCSGCKWRGQGAQAQQSAAAGEA